MITQHDINRVASAYRLHVNPMQVDSWGRATVILERDVPGTGCYQQAILSWRATLDNPILVNCGLYGRRRIWGDADRGYNGLEAAVQDIDRRFDRLCPVLAMEL